MLLAIIHGGLHERNISNNVGRRWIIHVDVYMNDILYMRKLPFNWWMYESDKATLVVNWRLRTHDWWQGRGRAERGWIPCSGPTRPSSHCVDQQPVVLRHHSSYCALSMCARSIHYRLGYIELQAYVPHIPSVLLIPPPSLSVRSTHYIPLCYCSILANTLRITAAGAMSAR